MSAAAAVGEAAARVSCAPPTTLADSERQFHVLVDHVTDYAIYMLDPEGNITTWNVGAQRIKGYSADEIIGQNLSLFYTEEDRRAERHLAALKKAEQEGRYEEAKGWRVRKDGSRFRVNAVMYPLRDEAGSLTGFVKVTRDITERLQHEAALERVRNAANQALAKQAAELEASNKELESFAYSVSHDLRAPLRHVVGYSELLQRQASAVLDEKSRRYIQTILESAKRMGDLIDDLLGFSRIGRAETNKTVVNLEQLVRQVIAELEQETSDRDIAWQIGTLPICYGDRSMLKIVLMNLISNSVKFTRMRKRAEIEIGCVDRNKDEAEVFVRDNGAGFDMRYGNKLFGVFQRLHRSEHFEGTGIGLATAQRIIHRHGGKMRAEGAIDRGASFYFSLPDVPDAAERTANTP
jgi:PAS domain S-box-containing protein